MSVPGLVGTCTDNNHHLFYILGELRGEAKRCAVNEPFTVWVIYDDEPVIIGTTHDPEEAKAMVENALRDRGIADQLEDEFNKMMGALISHRPESNQQ